MTTKYFAILTSQGAARLANAAAIGTKLNLTQMAVGDAGGVLPTPDPAQTKLINQKRVAPLNQLKVDPDNESQIIAEQIIPEDEGGFWIREIGLYDDAGVLIAVANCPETYKPRLQEGSGRTQIIRMVLTVSETAAVTLKIDPSVVLATRKFVDDKVVEVKAYADDLMEKHLASSDPHPGYALKTHIGFVTPEQFGYGPVGKGADSFAAAAAAASDNGWYIKLDGRQYDLGITPVDLRGVCVVGNKHTSVNGYFRNAGKLTGFNYGLSSVGQTELKTPRVFQLPASSVDGKFLVNFASNPDIWGIGMQNDSSIHRDTFMIMRRGNGGDKAPWEHIRNQQIFFGQAFAYQALASAILSGTFTDFACTPVQAGYPSGWGSSFAGYNLHIIAKRTTNPGDYIERVVQPDKDGYVNVGALIASTGSAFSVSIDGGPAVNVNARLSTTGIRIRTLRVYAGFADSVTVRVTHTGVTGQAMTVLGFNLHRPRETYASIAYDKFALYYDADADYAAGVGAGDYAMSNDALGFFGSYHGGEVALTPPVWRVDGTTVSTFVPEKPYAGSAIDLMEKTRIHNIVDTNIYQRWAGNGRHEMSITLKGTNNVPFEVSKMFLGMNGTYDAFSRIIYPEYAEGITGASTPDFLCGMTNMVVQENPSTGQLVYTYCNIEEGFPSAKGGVFVKTTDETGESYQKVYFAWVYDSPMLINKVSAQIVKVFC